MSLGGCLQATGLSAHQATTQAGTAEVCFKRRLYAVLDTTTSSRRLNTKTPKRCNRDCAGRKLKHDRATRFESRGESHPEGPQELVLLMEAQRRVHRVQTAGSLLAAIASSEAPISKALRGG